MDYDKVLQSTGRPCVGKTHEQYGRGNRGLYGSRDLSRGNYPPDESL